MRPFQFSLEKLLELRRRRLDEAEAELARALAELRTAAERTAALEREAELLDQRLRTTQSWRGRELAAGDAWRRALAGQRRTAAGEGRRREEWAAQARRELAEARAARKALESLRDKRLRLWEQALRREEDAVAVELFLARRSGPLR